MRLDNRGFSLIEMIIIIVILGIVMPVILMPFITASKGIQNPVDFTRLKYVARQNLDLQLACIDSNTCPDASCVYYCDWPVIGGGTASQTITETVDGEIFTTVVTWQFTDATFVATDGTSPTNNQYLAVSVTTTNSDGNSVTLQGVKGRDLIL